MNNTDFPSDRQSNHRDVVNAKNKVNSNIMEDFETMKDELNVLLGKIETEFFGYKIEIAGLEAMVIRSHNTVRILCALFFGALSLLFFSSLLLCTIKRT